MQGCLHGVGRGGGGVPVLSQPGRRWGGLRGVAGGGRPAVPEARLQGCLHGGGLGGAAGIFWFLLLFYFFFRF